MKKLLWMALVMLFVLIPLSASAETANINIGEAMWLDIMPGGYSTGSSASNYRDHFVPDHPFTGDYVISGYSFDKDTAIDFYNFSGQPVVYNVTFKDLYIAAADWCTAIRIQGNADITLNITNIGDTSIKTKYSHPPFKSNLSGDTKLNINVMNRLGSTFICDDTHDPYDISDPYGHVNTYGGSGTITFKINGRQLSSGYDKTDVTHTAHEWIGSVWSPDASDFMTESSFLSNAHGVSCAFLCVCGDQIEVKELQSTINNDGTGTYTAHLAKSEHWPEATDSITYTFAAEPLPPVTDMPATGDSARLLLWSAMLAASLVALLTMRKFSRSR